MKKAITRSSRLGAKRHKRTFCPPVVNEAELHEFLEPLVYPVVFLSFWDGPARAVFGGANPGEGVPIGYSVFSQTKQFEEPRHSDFRMDCQNGRRSLLEVLLSNIPDRGGSIGVWGRLRVRAILRQLAAVNPDMTSRVNEMVARLLDFSEPFRNGTTYVDKALRGSRSPEEVVSAICPYTSGDGPAVAPQSRASHAIYWICRVLQGIDDRASERSGREEAAMNV